MRQKIGALIAAGIVIGLAAVLFWGASASQTVLAGMQQTLDQQLTEALGSKVSIGNVQITSYNKVTVDKAVIFDKQGNEIAASDKVMVTFNPFSLLRGAGPVAAISGVTLVKPQLFLQQYPDKSWNVTELLQQKQTTKSEFTGRITAEDGTAVVETSQGKWPVEGINGRIDFDANPAIAVDLSLQYRNSGVVVKGLINSGGRDTLHIHADQIALQEGQPFLTGSPSIQLVTGLLQDLNLTVAREHGQFTYAGEARLVDGGADFNSLKIREAGGMLALTHNAVYLLSLKGKVNNQPLTVNGQIGTDGAEPALNLEVASDGFDPAAIGEYPFQGTVAFNLAVSGTMSQPDMAGSFNVKQGEIDGYAIANAGGKVHYYAQQLTLTSGQASLFGGRVTGDGSLNMANGAFWAELHGRQLNCAALPPGLPSLSGQGDVDLLVDGQGTLATASLQGTVTVGQGEAAGIPFTSLSAGFTRQQDTVSLDYFTMKLGEGAVTAAGTVTGRELALNVSGSQVPLDGIRNRVGLPSLEGQCGINGTVTGTIDNPVFNAVFDAADGVVLYQPFTTATGRIEMTSRQIKLSGVELIDHATTHKIDGTIGLVDGQPVNLTISSRHARAENLVKLLLPGEKLTGNVDNDVVLTGTLKQLNASGRVRLTEGSFRGYLLAKGEGSYQRVNGVTTIHDFTLQSLNTELKLSGEISAGNQLNFDIIAQNIDVAKLHFDYPYPVTGKANFSGKLTGTPQDPVFTGELLADSMVFNGQTLQDIHGSLQIHGSQMDIPNFSFTQSNGKYTFTGGIDTASEAVYGSLDVNNAELGALLPLFNVDTQDVSGRLNGHIQIGGTLKRPNVWLTGNMTGGKIKNYPLQNIDLDISLENNVITVSRFTANQGSGILAVRGTADLHGPLNLEIGGRDLDAGLLTAWLDTNIETKGKLSFGVQITGTAEKPSAAVSLEVKDGSVANATFDNLYGLFVIDKDNIHVNQLLLNKGTYRASAYGLIPLKALNTQGRQQASAEDQMNLKVRLDEANLSILPFLTKAVSWGAGQTKGEVTIGGTLAHPTLEGGIQIDNGVIKLAALADPIQKVGVDIRFEGDKININTFSGAMGSGSYSLTGSARLNGMALDDYNLTLKLDKLGVNSKYFKGPVQGLLKLDSTGPRPKLSGSLTFENDTINIPYIPEVSPSDLNIALDVDLLAANKVRFYNPYLYDIWTQGKVKLKGTTKYPDVSGHIDALRGTVNYLQTPFQVTEGRADFIQFRSFEPVITLSAQTKLEQTTVYMTAKGPVSAMDLRLSSQPEMNQQEIISLLTLRSRYYDKQKDTTSNTGLGRDELYSIMNAGLQMSFLSEVEGSFRNAFGLDEFQLVPGTLSDQDKAEAINRDVYSLEVGKYVTDRLFLSYTMGVDHTEQSMLVRYDLSPRISLTGSTDTQNNKKLELQARFRF
ncbi:translocation and assembly module tamb [Lucifera butyrica]|uniref:Translocation and assembly module tamb n=1 Tax=Lucifera butyrica TaxID=1351585 RepID=A0A498RCJ3_9FIRM|nr:translocation/assembly module TamB domain-containing protein [Lucifera butyrica]VBB09254.1 translocation and assembly module tamb [Lucifera butyrica]